jgi:DNA-binding Xre family transcriptional regulator
MRVDTLQAICEYLDCQPGDLLIHLPEALQTDNRHE